MPNAVKSKSRKAAAAADPAPTPDPVPVPVPDPAPVPVPAPAPVPDVEPTAPDGPSEDVPSPLEPDPAPVPSADDLDPADVTPPVVTAPPSTDGKPWYESAAFLTWVGSQALSIAAFVLALIGHPLGNDAAAQGAVATGALVISGVTTAVFTHGVHGLAIAKENRAAADAAADLAAMKVLSLQEYGLHLRSRG